MGACWGSFALEVGAVGRWRLGALELHVERREREWRVATTHRDDPLLDVDEHALVEVIPEGAPFVRFVAGHSEGVLHLTALLADRPVLIRPEAPLRVLGGEEALLFVGTPLWVGLARGPDRRPLCEVPTWRPSDSWFGPDTTRGELCYSGRTQARLDLANLLRRPARAITAVRVRNEHPDPLALERIKVPVPHLRLYLGDDGFLWTSSLTLTRAGESPSVDVDVTGGPGAEAGSAKRIGEARQAGSPSVLVRALDALWK